MRTETHAVLEAADGTKVPLVGVEVRAEVVAGYACATVRQRYKNGEAHAIEATYTFPLPSKSVVTGFAMTCAGRRLEGMVQEKGDAFRRYDEAVAAGHGGALLEQARPNVWSAAIGNLLPGEETTIEVQYVEPLLADEGAVRWSIPTLVAPRYVAASVVDAERVSPPIGAATYGLDLEVTFDLGAEVDVESPSHAIETVNDGGKTRARLRQADVALDRDVVIYASAKKSADAAAPIASSVCHRERGETGTLAVMLVPDLGASKEAPRARQLVFVIDRSGSMGGAAMAEARTALRLCLRQLREGDRFNVLAFDTAIEPFANELVPYGPATLAKVDAWIGGIDARGGTELLAPMLEAARLAPDGVIVLLTDGEVANEAEISDAFMAARGSARVYSFGIGSNVSDALLTDLADRTAGAVEHIHPGERIDEKVVAQFARATAARVTDLRIKARGIELGEIAPAEGRVLVDGEPCAFFARYEQSGRGAIEIRGLRDGEPFYVEVLVDLEHETERPAIEKLWAQARIRDLERANVGGRRAETMKERIVTLAQTYGVSSKYTSFVVVEKRTGDRRMNAQPETRVVPVAPPAGWATSRSRHTGGVTRGTLMSPRPAAGMPSPMSARARRAAPPPPRSFAMSAPPAASRSMIMPARSAPAYPPPCPAPTYEADEVAAAPPSSSDPVLGILSRQAASGLWESPGRDPVDVTVEAMLQLVRLGLSSRHMIHGAQIKKAIDALLARITANRATDVKLRELALGVAWLLATGKRTRSEIELAAKGSALEVTFGSEPAVRAHVERLAAA
ncbi:MAG: VWA domain-containing protein [Labilithrix sp.]|nr:VWA domain-containing protein [Labilithrix sp.]MCW5817415.1 VWA domain-containing protein [Labilithrix sp.]